MYKVHFFLQKFNYKLVHSVRSLMRVCICVQIIVWTKQLFEIFSTYISATDDWRCYKAKGLKDNIVENIEQIALFFFLDYIYYHLCCSY